LSYPSFERASEVVGQFIKLLAEHDVDLRQGGAAEGEALAMIDILDMWQEPARRTVDPRPVARAAMGSWIWQARWSGSKIIPTLASWSPICRCSAKQLFYRTQPAQ